MNTKDRDEIIEMISKRIKYHVEDDHFLEIHPCPVCKHSTLSYKDGHSFIKVYCVVCGTRLKLKQTSEWVVDIEEDR